MRQNPDEPVTLDMHLGVVSIGRLSANVAFTTYAEMLEVADLATRRRVETLVKSVMVGDEQPPPPSMWSWEVVPPIPEDSLMGQMLKTAERDRRDEAVVVMACPDDGAACWRETLPAGTATDDDSLRAALFALWTRRGDRPPVAGWARLIDPATGRARRDEWQFVYCPVQRGGDYCILIDDPLEARS